MNIKELLEKRAALLAEVQKPETTAERFNEIRSEIERLNFSIETAQKAAADEKREEELRAARKPNPAPADGVVFDQSKKTEEKRKSEAIEATEKRGQELRNGETVKLERRSISSSSAAIATPASGEINPAFEQVGTIDRLVHITPLHGAESYKKPFVKSYGTGGITAEGTAATTAEPTMDYATINKIKITAYAEITEETEKLPLADYAKVVDEAAYGAYRKKLIQQIVNGSGSSQLVGIVNAPTTIIEATQRKTIATVDENTLDNIIFDYGGDESVEGDAYLILNKLTLKAFATVKGTDKKRAYDIVVKGNTGTINGIPFVCTSNLAAYTTVTAGNPYMLYGKLQGYELTEFSPIEMSKSKDYKFKEGMTAIKVVGMVGGSPAMWNGFMSIQKAAS